MLSLGFRSISLLVGISFFCDVEASVIVGVGFGLVSFGFGEDGRVDFGVGVGVPVGFGLFWFGSVWFGLVWFGLVWFGCWLFLGAWRRQTLDDNVTARSRRRVV